MWLSKWHVNPWLVHVNVWQKPLQYYNIISLQLITINEKQMKCLLQSLHSIPSESAGEECGAGTKPWISWVVAASTPSQVIYYLWEGTIPEWFSLFHLLMLPKCLKRWVFHEMCKEHWKNALNFGCNFTPLPSRLHL